MSAITNIFTAILTNSNVTALSSSVFTVFEEQEKKTFSAQRGWKDGDNLITIMHMTPAGVDKVLTFEASFRGLHQMAEDPVAMELLNSVIQDLDWSYILNASRWDANKERRDFVRWLYNQR